MICCDDVDRSVSQPCSHSLNVGCGAERRIHLVDGVVGGNEIFCEHEVVRRRFGRNVDATRFRPSNDFYRTGRREMANMQARSHMFSEQHIAGDDRFFGYSGPARQAQARTEHAFVHLRASGEPRLLRVLRNNAVEGLYVFEGTTHQQRVGHALAIVRKDSHLRS